MEQGDINSTPSESVIAFNVPASSPVISKPVDNHQVLPVQKNIVRLQNSSDILIDTAD